MGVVGGWGAGRARGGKWGRRRRSTMRAVARSLRRIAGVGDAQPIQVTQGSQRDGAQGRIEHIHATTFRPSPADALTILLHEPEEDARRLEHVEPAGVLVDDSRNAAVGINLEELGILLLLLPEVEPVHVVRQLALREIRVRRAELLERNTRLVPVRRGCRVQVDLGWSLVGRARRGRGEGGGETHGWDGRVEERRGEEGEAGGEEGAREGGGVEEGGEGEHFGEELHDRGERLCTARIGTLGGRRWLRDENREDDVVECSVIMSDRARNRSPPPTDQSWTRLIIGWGGWGTSPLTSWLLWLHSSSTVLLALPRSSCRVVDIARTTGWMEAVAGK